jgi:hypothetical protein
MMTPSPDFHGNSESRWQGEALNSPCGILLLSTSAYLSPSATLFICVDRDSARGSLSFLCQFVNRPNVMCGNTTTTLTQRHLPIEKKQSTTQNQSCHSRTGAKRDRIQRSGIVTPLMLGWFRQVTSTVSERRQLRMTCDWRRRTMRRRQEKRWGVATDLLQREVMCAWLSERHLGERRLTALTQTRPEKM